MTRFRAADLVAVDRRATEGAKRPERQGGASCPIAKDFRPCGCIPAAAAASVARRSTATDYGAWSGAVMGIEGGKEGSAVFVAEGDRAGMGAGLTLRRGGGGTTS
jgi:hypothetical protein